MRHVHIGHGPGLYALVDEEERCYVVCEHCGRISRLPPAEIEAIRARIGKASGYEAHFSHFPILGLCPPCAARRDRRGRERETVSEGGAMADEHEHDHEGKHSHEHSHGDVTHSHPHDDHDHDHVEHEHEHSHGDRVHSHPHVHQEGMEEEHEHSHED